MDNGTLGLIAVVLGVAAMSIDRFTGGRTAGFFALAESIARAEGYGQPGAIPTVRNNPGDLVFNGEIATFDTPDDGWNALYGQLDRIRQGTSRFYTVGMTLGTMASIWTATEQQAWLSNVLIGLRARGIEATRDTTIAEVIL